MENSILQMSEVISEVLSVPQFCIKYQNACPLVQQQVEYVKPIFYYVQKKNVVECQGMKLMKWKLTSQAKQPHRMLPNKEICICSSDKDLWRLKEL